DHARPHDEQIAGGLRVVCDHELIVEGKIVVIFFKIAHRSACKSEAAEKSPHKIFDNFPALSRRSLEELLAALFRRTAPAYLLNFSGEIASGTQVELRGSQETVGHGRQERSVEQCAAILRYDQGVRVLLVGRQISEGHIFVCGVEEQQ